MSEVRIILTGSSRWYGDLDKLGVAIYDTLETHLAEQVCYVLCLDIDADLLIDFLYFNLLLPVP